MRIAQIDIPAFTEDFFRKAGPGRWRILSLTYRFDPALFEARFESVLTRGNIQCDVVTGEKSGSTSPRRLEYHIWRANWPGTFHPKILVLLANDQIAVGVGSANLTEGGLGGNLEIWHFFAQRPDDRPVLAGLRKFIELLLERRIISKNVKIEEFIRALPKMENHALLTTLAGTLIDQVKARLTNPIKKVEIISPIYCDPQKVVLQIRTFATLSPCTLYTSMKKVPKIQGINEYWDLVPPADFDNDEKLIKFTMPHAKIYAFFSSKWVDLFWGSANLSPSAWLMSGRKANVDLLVHTRVSFFEWKRLRDRLPAGHKWEETSPAKKVTLPNEERVTDRWRLLNAFFDGNILSLEGSGSGRFPLRLRSFNRGNGFRSMYSFQNSAAMVPQSISQRLGLFSANPPQEIQSFEDSEKAWLSIPINYLDNLSGSGKQPSVADQLIWQYTGRIPPSRGGKGPSTRKPYPGDPDTDEEKELTQSLDQGKLDEFVLKWRLIALKIARNYRKNIDLMKYHFKNASSLVQTEAKKNPPGWPQPQIRFVNKLFKSLLEEAQCRESKK